MTSAFLTAPTSALTVLDERGGLKSDVPKKPEPKTRSPEPKFKPHSPKPAPEPHPQPGLKPETINFPKEPDSELGPEG